MCVCFFLILILQLEKRTFVLSFILSVFQQGPLLFFVMTFAVVFLSNCSFIPSFGGAGGLLSLVAHRHDATRAAGTRT